MLFQNKQAINRKSLRKYERVECDEPLRFKSFSEELNKGDYCEDFEAEGTSKDISPGGIRFQTKHRPPRISNILWVGLDPRAVNAISLGVDTAERPLVFDRGLLGKVIHVEHDLERHIYNIGVSFVTKFNAALP